MMAAVRLEPCVSGGSSPTFVAMVDGTDWAARYLSGDTPWDLGGPHPELSARLQDGRLLPPRPGATAFVPGAGAGHDALALARRGWAVTAVDLVELLAPRVGPDLERKGGRFVVGDAIEFGAEGAFDLVWDHTFFCAIPPGRREAWGRQVNSLLAPGGVYAALVFPVSKPASEGGRPSGWRRPTCARRSARSSASRSAGRCPGPSRAGRGERALVRRHPHRPRSPLEAHPGAGSRVSPDGAPG